VVLVGPHKTGSTHITDFLARHAAYPSHRPPYLLEHNWAWPHPSHPNSTANKVFAASVREMVNNHSRAGYEQTRVSIARAVGSGFDVVLASEALAMGTRHPAEIAAGLHDWLQPCAKREVVVMLRTPRVSHLLSVWSQVRFLPGNPRIHSRAARDSFKAFVCDLLRPDLAGGGCYRKPSAPTGCEPVVEPLRLAATFFDVTDYVVTIVEMTDLGKQGLDIADVVACEILKVPCGDNNTRATWSHGDNVASANVKPYVNVLNLDQPELDLLEHMLAATDCVASGMLGSERLRVLHRTAAFGKPVACGESQDRKAQLAALLFSRACPKIPVGSTHP